MEQLLRPGFFVEGIATASLSFAELILRGGRQSGSALVPFQIRFEN
ncbi:hypothetical protein [Sphingomonas sp. URHD0057]|nr:hypothetical protein [Sphingomonas sp. URHD0057]